MDTLIPEEEVPKLSPKAPQIKSQKIVKPAKPLVEGINSPRTTADVVRPKSTLTPQEKQLISESDPYTPQQERLLPQAVSTRMAKKPHRIKGLIITGLILVALVAGAYEYYVWNTAKSILPVPSYPTPQVISPQTNAANSTSTLLSLPITASSTPTSTPVNMVKINNTPTGYLNVRQAPSSSSKVITQVHPGETYVYTQSKNGWYQITMNGFNSGWVSGQYVTRQ